MSNKNYCQCVGLLCFVLVLSASILLVEGENEGEIRQQPAKQQQQAQWHPLVHCWLWEVGVSLCYGLANCR